MTYVVPIIFLMVVQTETSTLVFGCGPWRAVSSLRSGPINYHGHCSVTFTRHIIVSK